MPPELQSAHATRRCFVLPDIIRTNVRLSSGLHRPPNVHQQASYTSAISLFYAAVLLRNAGYVPVMHSLDYTVCWISRRPRAFRDVALAGSYDNCRAFLCAPILATIDINEADSSNGSLPSVVRLEHASQPSPQNTAGAASGSLGALLAGFDCEASVTRSDLRRGIQLARELASRRFAPVLTTLAVGIAPAFAPSSSHAQWGNAGGLINLAPRRATGGMEGGSGSGQTECSDTDDDPNVDDADEAGDLFSPAQLKAIERLCRWELVFAESAMEEDYRTWNNSRSMQHDACTLVLLLLTHVIFMFVGCVGGHDGSNVAHHMTKHFHVEDRSAAVAAAMWQPIWAFWTCFGNGRVLQRGEWLPCVLLMGMLISIRSRRLRWRYRHHRDVLMVGLYLTLSLFHLRLLPHVPAIRGGCVPSDMAAEASCSSRASVGNMAGAALLGLAIQARFEYMLTALIALSAVHAGLFFTTLDGAGWALWTLSTLLPAVVLYLKERQSRKQFCLSPAAATWVWG
jgi:hypothetical protein